jgi:hypothetical protein
MLIHVRASSSNSCPIPFYLLPSAMSRALDGEIYNLKVEIRTRQTRSQNPKELSDEDVKAKEDKLEGLIQRRVEVHEVQKASRRKEKEEKLAVHFDNVNAHTTNEADKVAGKVDANFELSEQMHAKMFEPAANKKRKREEDDELMLDVNRKRLEIAGLPSNATTAQVETNYL